MKDRQEDSGARQPRLPLRGEAKVAEIPFADFVRAKRDPAVARFLEEAKVESEELKRRGLLHPGG